MFGELVHWYMQHDLHGARMAEVVRREGRQWNPSPNLSLFHPPPPQHTHTKTNQITVYSVLFYFIEPIFPCLIPLMRALVHHGEVYHRQKQAKNSRL